MERSDRRSGERLVLSVVLNLCRPFPFTGHCPLTVERKRVYFRLRSLYFSFENFEIRFLDPREIPIFLINLSKGFYITIILLYYYNNARDICEIIYNGKGNS